MINSAQWQGLHTHWADDLSFWPFIHLQVNFFSKMITEERCERSFWKRSSVPQAAQSSCNYSPIRWEGQTCSRNVILQHSIPHSVTNAWPQTPTLPLPLLLPSQISFCSFRLFPEKGQGPSPQPFLYGKGRSLGLAGTFYCSFLHEFLIVLQYAALLL